jgi:ferritin
MPKYTQFNYFISKDKDQSVNQLAKFLKKRLNGNYKDFEMIYSYDEKTKEHTIELKS